MERQRLVRIVVEGFASISSATVDLRALNVLVGANGAGKSNLIRAFGMLGSIFAGDLRFYVGQSGGQALSCMQVAQRLPPCASRCTRRRQDIQRN